MAANDEILDGTPIDDEELQDVAGGANVAYAVAGNPVIGSNNVRRPSTGRPYGYDSRRVVNRGVCPRCGAGIYNVKCDMTGRPVQCRVCGYFFR